jgi:hypothetical protein
MSKHPWNPDTVASRLRARGIIPSPGDEYILDCSEATIRTRWAVAELTHRDGTKSPLGWPCQHLGDPDVIAAELVQRASREVSEQ